MTDWVVNLIDAGGYWGIALLMALENIFPPLPSELIMGIGGIRAGQGQMDVVPLLIAGTVGTVIGNYPWYWLGHKLGEARLRAFVARFGRWLTLDWQEVDRLSGLFRRRGEFIVFFVRFMPTFRTIISLPAGLFRMKHSHFILCTAAGSLIWNMMLLGAGYFLGANFKRIDDYLGPVATATIIAVAVYYVWRLISWRPRTAE